MAMVLTPMMMRLHTMTQLTKGFVIMIKLITTGLFLGTLTFGAPVIAGPGHEHDSNGGHSHAHGPISSDKVIGKASKKLIKLATAGKIDASWSEVKANGAKQKTYANGPEWVITFSNNKVADSSKQTLYMFYSLDGHYIAANYSGN
jgi:hypothetical protein